MAVVIFVCTGNTCRSPMAEALAKDSFAKKGICTHVFKSRGIFAGSPAKAAQNAALALKQLCGASLLEQHTSKQITHDDICTADFILTMTSEHKGYIEKLYPDRKCVVATLAEFTGAGTDDIPDPYGGSIALYIECAKTIKNCIDNIISRGLIDMSENIKIENTRIAIGCDHGGFGLMEHIRAYLKEKNIDFKDFGVNSEKAADYPEMAKAVAGAILSGECKTGILICGTGIGVSIAANRHKGIRAALCHDVFSAKATRLHNDANILVMGGRVIASGHAIEILKAFLNTSFSNEHRHKKRISLLDENI